MCTRDIYSPIRNLAILADFACITTSNSHHSRDGGSVRGVGDNGTLRRVLRTQCQCSPGSLDSDFVNWWGCALAHQKRGVLLLA